MIGNKKGFDKNLKCRDMQYEVNQSLKEILKPPFKANDCEIKGQEDYPYLTAIHDISQGVYCYNSYLEWIAKALNEKYERDFGEPLRWYFSGDGACCPKCDHFVRLYSVEDIDSFNYCPCCGQKLDKPERK